MNKQIHKEYLETLSSYSSYIDQKCGIFYDNIFMLSNITLSKNRFTGTKFLENLIIKKKLKQSFFFIIKKIIKFYLKNLYYFFYWISLYFFNFLLTKNNFIVKKNNIIVDTFYGESNFFNSLDFKDNYFDELYEYFEKNKMHYYIFLKFHDLNNRPLSFLKTIYFIKKIKKNIITEFDILIFFDFFSIIRYIITYPIILFKKIYSIKISNSVDQLFVYDLIDTLDKTTFHNYINYIVGKKINKKFRKSNLKIISWFENQNCNKLFYQGIKHNDTLNVKIYGCQFLLKCKGCAWHYINEKISNEIYIPDELLVTGKAYVPINSKKIYKIGPAFRYKHMNLTSSIYPINKNLDNILVMLPYHQSDCDNIINRLKKSKILENKNIKFKIHPDFLKDKKIYQKKLLKNWSLIDKINFDEFPFSFLITNASGTPLEYAAKGISILLINSSGTYIEYHPMPINGYQEIWNIVKDSDSVDLKLANLINFRKNNPDKIILYAKYYLKNYFSVVDENVIKKNFEF